MWYRADYEDKKFEIIYAGNDKDAMKESKKHEEHGIIFNLFELNEDFDEVRTVY